jgi:D-alanyl-D-alanine carboxypeptidase/D-alanyl-D-alanine-endopeptidase (penicillin-binding protein 4)
VWAEAIMKLGIKKIQGKVIGDASLWEKFQAPPSWAWEDLGNYYGAGASALSFHENAYMISFAPGAKEGDPVSVLRTTPRVLQTIISEVKTGPVNSGDQACIYGSEFSATQMIRGTIPLGVSEFSIKGSIPDPVALCEKLLSQTLGERGILVQGLTISNPNRSVIHVTHSPKMRDIVYWTNQKSINLYAEHLLKKIGEKVYGEGSTTSGINAALDFWKRLGIEGFNMVDGSGLSRKNFITTKQLTSMLIKIKQSPYFSVLFNSLPQIREGIYAKSGSMSSLRGYAGYKGEVAFAILINHYTDRKEIGQEFDKILDSL